MAKASDYPVHGTPATTSDSLFSIDDSTPEGFARIMMPGKKYMHLNGVAGWTEDGAAHLSDFGEVGTGSDDSAVWQAALDSVCSSGRPLIVDPPTDSGGYNISVPLSVTNVMLADRGLTIFGNGPYRSIKINYTGTGYCFNFTGDGDEGAGPIKNINLENLWITGGELNTISTGGFYFDRAYIVKILNCASTLWESSSAHAVEIRNIFNFDWNGGQLANNFGTDTTGDSVVVVGADDPNAWNNSNVAFRNTLIQNGGSHGLEVIHDSNIFDNLIIDNVSFGKNAGDSLHIDNANVANVTIKNNHFESSGYTGTGTPTAGTRHIYIKDVKGGLIANNSMQDSLGYIELDGADGFVVDSNKLFETGFYTLTGNTAIKIRSTSQTALVQIGANEIRDDQIDNIYDFDTTSRIHQVGGGIIYQYESYWTAHALSNPENWKGMIINRTGSANSPYDQMYSPDGASWYRVMISNHYRGESSSIPTETGAQGYFWLNTAGTVQNDGTNNYILLGWYYTGGSWREMRVLTT